MKIGKRVITRPVRIEMVPLIDIVFLLLVFFIYAMLSMAVQRGMNVDLPVSSRTVRAPESSLSVSVEDRGGRAVVYLNKEKMTLAGLETRLRQEAGKGTNKPEVLIFVDKAVSYQQLYQVLDRINAAGISALSLQAEQKR